MSAFDFSANLLQSPTPVVLIPKPCASSAAALPEMPSLSDVSRGGEAIRGGVANRSDDASYRVETEMDVYSLRFNVH